MPKPEASMVNCSDGGLELAAGDRQLRFPAVWLLHCLRAADQGGDTGLVDGFAAATALRAADAGAFQVLARTPVPFGYTDSGTELRASQPLIQLSPRGRVRGVRFNHRSERPLRPRRQARKARWSPRPCCTTSVTSAAAFEALPHARAAVAVRRWDDAAKDPAVTPPGFAHFAPLIAALVRT
jgi:predicted HD phosphohydrolase